MVLRLLDVKIIIITADAVKEIQLQIPAPNSHIKMTTMMVGVTIVIANMISPITVVICAIRTTVKAQAGTDSVSSSGSSSR